MYRRDITNSLRTITTQQRFTDTTFRDISEKISTIEVHAVVYIQNPLRVHNHRMCITLNYTASYQMTDMYRVRNYVYTYIWYVYKWSWLCVF